MNQKKVWPNVLGWKYAQKCQIRPEMVKNAKKTAQHNGFLGSKKIYTQGFFFVDSEAHQTEICSWVVKSLKRNVFYRKYAESAKNSEKWPKTDKSKNFENLYHLHIGIYPWFFMMIPT